MSIILAILFTALTPLISYIFYKDFQICGFDLKLYLASLCLFDGKSRKKVNFSSHLLLIIFVHIIICTSIFFSCFLLISDIALNLLIVILTMLLTPFLIIFAHLFIALFEKPLKRKNKKFILKNSVNLEFLNNGDIFIIEDNDNPSLIDASNALNILDSYERSKIVVTTGIAHMLKDRNYENFKLGTMIADVADYVVILNEDNKNFILSGLISHNFNKDKIFFASDYQSLVDILTRLTQGSCAVLLENI